MGKRKDQRKEGKKKKIKRKLMEELLQLLSLKAIVKTFEGLGLCSPCSGLGSC